MITVISAGSVRVGDKIAMKMEDQSPRWVTGVQRQSDGFDLIRIHMDDEWEVDLSGNTLVIVDRRM